MAKFNSTVKKIYKKAISPKKENERELKTTIESVGTTEYLSMRVYEQYGETDDYLPTKQGLYLNSEDMPEILESLFAVADVQDIQDALIRANIQIEQYNNNISLTREEDICFKPEKLESTDKATWGYKPKKTLEDVRNSMAQDITNTNNQQAMQSAINNQNVVYNGPSQEEILNSMN